MTNNKKTLKNWHRQNFIHKLLWTLFVVWTILIVACSYAVFEKTFNTWISSSGSWFIPFLISVDIIWGLCAYFWGKLTIKSVKKALSKVYTSDRIRKKDFDKVLASLEEADVNQDNFEKETQEAYDNEKIIKKARGTKEILEIYKEVQNEK